jgi:hypothetical protein
MRVAPCMFEAPATTVTNTQSDAIGNKPQVREVSRPIPCGRLFAVTPRLKFCSLHAQCRPAAAAAATAKAVQRPARAAQACRRLN